MRICWRWMVVGCRQIERYRKEARRVSDKWKLLPSMERYSNADSRMFPPVGLESAAKWIWSSVVFNTVFWTIEDVYVFIKKVIYLTALFFLLFFSSDTNTSFSYRPSLYLIGSHLRRFQLGRFRRRRCCQWVAVEEASLLAARQLSPTDRMKILGSNERTLIHPVLMSLTVNRKRESLG